MEKVSKTVVSDGIMEPRDVNTREPGCEREFFSSIQLSENLYYNGHLQVVVADFEERQCPAGHDGQERSCGNEYHRPRNAICNLLPHVFLSLKYLT